MFGNMAQMFLPNDRKLLDYEEKASIPLLDWIECELSAEVNAFSRK